MVSARVSWQQGFEKNNSKIRSYPPDSELHVCTVIYTKHDDVKQVDCRGLALITLNICGTSTFVLHC